MKDLPIKPSFQTRYYKPSEAVRIVDRYEQFLFIKHGARPLDIYESHDNLVMVFSKSETSELYELYRQYKLK